MTRRCGGRDGVVGSDRCHRRPRRELTGGTRHATARGTGRIANVRDEVDANRFVAVVLWPGAGAVGVARPRLLLDADHFHLWSRPPSTGFDRGNAWFAQRTPWSILKRAMHRSGDLARSGRRAPDRVTTTASGGELASLSEGDAAEAPRAARPAAFSRAELLVLLGASAPLGAPALELAPEEIRVRDQEAEGDAGQRG